MLRGVLVAAVVAACAPGGLPTPAMTGTTDESVRYVALGDSYTIGTGVSEPERWPNQLVTRIGAGHPRLELVANLAVNGYTTRDLIEEELPELAALRPELVTVLIGVNDVVQRVPEATFRENAAYILDELVAAVGPQRVVLVTIPDYTVTPAGADYGDPGVQSAAIRRFNEVLADLAAVRGIAVVDVYGISLGAAEDRSLVAADGLHPSGEQYRRWVDVIVPRVEGLLAP